MEKESVFKSLYDRIFNVANEKKTQEPNLVSSLTGLQDKIKSLVKLETVLPKALDDFTLKYTKGRVPFDVFEKYMHPKSPNKYPSEDRFGISDLIKFVGDNIDDMTEEDVSLHIGTKFKVHKYLRTMEKYTDENGQDIIDMSYSQSYDKHEELTNAITNWRDGLDYRRSYRDQMIDVRTRILRIVHYMSDLRFGMENQGYREYLLTRETQYREILGTGDTIINENQNQLEEMVGSFKELLRTFDPTMKVERDRSSNISNSLRNPVFRYVKSEFLNAHITSIPKEASSIASNTTPAGFGADQVSAMAAPEARMAAPSPGTGDRIQSEKTVENVTEYSETVGPLNKEQYSKWQDWLRNRESSNDYKKVNQIGFCGAYQFGGPALCDLGYVKSGVKTRSLVNDDSWTGKDGITSREKFLENKELQDKLLLMYTRINYKVLINSGALKKTDTPAHVGGMLAAAHLVGAGGAKNLANNIDKSDANGTTASSYYDAASKAVGGETETKTTEEAQTNMQAVNESTIPDSMPFGMPPSPAGGVYPYNQVKATEGGHVQEFDNTPGSERINLKHAKGTGYEVFPDGTWKHVVNGSSYSAVLGNDFIIVNGACNIYVEGDAGVVAKNVNINAGQDLNVTTGGNLNLDVSGDFNVRVRGGKTENIQGDAATIIGGFSVTGIDGDMMIDAESSTIAARQGNFNVLAQGELNVISEGNAMINTAANMSIASEGNMGVSAKGDMFSTASGDNVMSGTDVAVYGSGKASLSSTDTSIASGGVIKLSHPVEKARYADTAQFAIPGIPQIVDPSATSEDGGSGEKHTKNTENLQFIKPAIEKFSPSDFNSTQANSGGGDGVKGSTKNPISTARSGGTTTV